MYTLYNKILIEVYKKELFPLVYSIQYTIYNIQYTVYSVIKKK